MCYYFIYEVYVVTSVDIRYCRSTRLLHLDTSVDVKLRSMYKLGVRLGYWDISVYAFLA